MVFFFGENFHPYFLVFSSLFFSLVRSRQDKPNILNDDVVIYVVMGLPRWVNVDLKKKKVV